MLHRSIKFVHLAVLAFSAVLSFLFLRSLDEHQVLGHTAVIWVTDTDGSSNGLQVADAVSRFATEHRASVAREVPDLKKPYSTRHLYMTPGGPRSDWLSKGYPAFNSGYRTEVHPVTELGRRDPRGFYYVFGTDRDAAALVAMFSDLGLRSSITHPFSLAELASSYGDGALYSSVFVVALATVATTGSGVLLNAKGYGVLRLQGWSLGQIMLRDLRQLARFWAIAFTGVSTVTVAGLSAYNGLAWFGWYALLAAGIGALLSLVVLAAHAAMLCLTCQTEILGALKGEIPARAASLSAYAVRIPALLLALSIASSVVLAGQEILDRQESAKAYAGIGQTTSIALNGSLASKDDLEQLNRKVGSWLREADKEGNLIVVGHRGLRKSAPRTDLPPGDILLVNESFLAHQPLYEASGRRVEPTAQNRAQIRLFVPKHLTSHTDRLRRLVPGLLNPGKPGTVDPADITTVSTRDDQSVFTYNPRGHSRAGASPDADESFVRDPVVIAFPNGSRYLSTGSYAAYASQSSIVFPDPDDVDAAIERHHLDTYVTGMVPVAENAALRLRRVVGEFRLQLFNLAVAVSVLLITGIGVCIVHSRKNAQRVFARHISGWTFSATHRPVLVVEAALALLLAAWMPWQVWQQNRDLAKFEALGVPPPRAPVELTGVDVSVTGVLITVEVLAVLAALVVFHRRIVKEGATQS